jgi:hypothetical protein
MTDFDDIMCVDRQLRAFFAIPYTGPVPETPQSETRTAYHEAGHAVIAFVVGCAPLYITIVPENGRCGTTTRVHPIPPQEEAAYLIAGAVAEVKSHPDINLSCVVNVARTDIGKIRRLRDDDEPLDIAAALSRADELLTQNWPRVERIAERLVTDKMLDTLAMTEVWNDTVAAA